MGGVGNAFFPGVFRAAVGAFPASTAAAPSTASLSASSIHARIRAWLTGSCAETVNSRLSRILRRANNSPKIVAMGLGRPLRQDGLEEDFADPFAD